MSHKKPVGSKVANASKQIKEESAYEDSGIKSALDSCTKRFSEAGSASIEAANTRVEVDCDPADKELTLRKEQNEIEAVRLLFNDEDEESLQYKKALKRKRLRKLLKEEEEEASVASRVDFRNSSPLRDGPSQSVSSLLQ